MHHTCTSPPEEDVLLRICGEYYEMPGLRLSARQAQRLFGLSEAECKKLFGELLARRFLARHPDGTYARRTDGPVRAPQRLAAYRD